MDYTTLSIKPVLFSRFSGLSIAEFNKLAIELKPLWNKAEIKRLSRPDRRRKIGGGRNYKLRDFKDKLLFVLAFYKFYPTFELLGFLFENLEKGCVSRLIDKLEPVLRKKMKLPELKRERRKPISTLEELIYLYPEIVEFIGDATGQQIPRPKDKKKKKEYYSGKEKKHLVKTQLFIEKNRGIILEASPPFPGSWHDYQYFKLTNAAEKLPKDIPCYFDRGYQGAKKDYPLHKFHLPKKANRWRKLTEKDKENNHGFGKIRIKVEHAILKCKRFKILSQIYRHSLKDYHKRFKIIAGLVNFKIKENIEQLNKLPLIIKNEQPILINI